ncbi:hypothetical protein OHT93_03340 [Streptomyces sp. NBC_00191]|uniref:hypothetical protein n=1 Tax=Streptomyces sp. NBC_00191 TaxID=2975674 RepID=UPI0032490728
MAVEGERLDPVFDLPAVGVGELEDKEDRLGGDAPDAAGASGFDGFGEGVLRAAVVDLDTVPQRKWL